MLDHLLTSIHELPRTPHVEPEIELVTILCVNRCGQSIVVDVNDDHTLEDEGWKRVGDQWACPFAETD